MQKIIFLSVHVVSPARSSAAAGKTIIYICKTIYFAYAKLYVLCTVYTFAYAETYTFAKHIVLHMQNYMFCLTYEKLHILNKKATRIL